MAEYLLWAEENVTPPAWAGAEVWAVLNVKKKNTTQNTIKQKQYSD